MYKTSIPFEGKSRGVIRVSDNAFIPLDPDNRDFQEYQEWLALGNQPIPADEQPSS